MEGLISEGSYNWNSKSTLKQALGVLTKIDWFLIFNCKKS